MTEHPEITSQNFPEVLQTAIQQKYPRTGATEVARRLRVAPQTIGKLLRGDYYVPNTLRARSGRMNSIIRIAKTLSLPVDQCIAACGLPPAPEHLVLAAEPEELSIDDLEFLLEIVQKLEAPIPLAAALSFLAVRQQKKREEG